jgi:hypothetical protein
LSDLTIARLGRDRFQIGANGNLDFDRLTRLWAAAKSGLF